MNSPLIHHVKRKDVLWLQEFFATLTPEGWVIPEWLLLMERHVANTTPPPG